MNAFVAVCTAIACSTVPNSNRTGFIPIGDGCVPEAGYVTANYVVAETLAGYSGSFCAAVPGGTCNSCSDPATCNSVTCEDNIYDYNRDAADGCEAGHVRPIA